MSENAYVNLVRNDTAHSISQTRINKNVNANSSKHLVACPFLLKKEHCLKGSRCDFSHNISQSRTSKKASVNPLKEATEVSNDVVYPTTFNDSSVSTNSSAPNEMYAIPVRITTRRCGKRNSQKFRRGNSEHFLWDSGNPNRPPESKPESQLENHNSWKAYLQSVNQTLDQTWNPSIGENLCTNDDIFTNLSYNPPPRNSNNLITIHVCKPGPPESRSIPTCMVINARSLAKPDACSALCLELNSRNVDLGIVTETWLKSTIPSQVVCPDGFTVIRKDRPYGRQGGWCSSLL